MVLVKMLEVSSKTHLIKKKKKYFFTKHLLKGIFEDKVQPFFLLCFFMHISCLFPCLTLFFNFFFYIFLHFCCEIVEIKEKKKTERKEENGR